MPEFEEALAMALHDEKQSRKGLQYPPTWEDRSEQIRGFYRNWASLVKPALARMAMDVAPKSEAIA